MKMKFDSDSLFCTYYVDDDLLKYTDCNGFVFEVHGACKFFDADGEFDSLSISDPNRRRMMECTFHALGGTIEPLFCKLWQDIYGYRDHEDRDIKKDREMKKLIVRLCEIKGYIER